MSIKIFSASVGLMIVCCATMAIAWELPSNTSFLKTEISVTGQSSSALWQSGASGYAFDQIGGQQPDEFGGGIPAEEEKKIDDGTPSDLGPKIKAGVFSALLPGAGQYFNGDKKKAYLMAGVEGAIWISYFVFDAQGDARMESAREYADIYSGANGDHAESYWQSVGRYMDSDSYNDSRRREARALQEEVSGLVTGADTWQWVNDTRRTDFTKMRADGNTAYDHRDFMILFSVVNRAISVVDAVIGVGNKDGHKPGTLETEVLGMNMELGLLPSWRDPGAQCVVSRSF
ncbi:MAG: hypothetical protein GY780_14645 [bacterium]|nr:hypothetical protein [bacterium]